MLSRRSVLTGALALSAAPTAVISAETQELYKMHWEALGAIIRSRAIARGPGGVALIGDSLTEVMWWPELAGHRTVNLGFGGARTRNLLGYIGEALSHAKPDAAIIMATINNAVGPLAPDEHAAFPDEYRTLVRTVKNATSKVALMTITPVEAGKFFSTTYENQRVMGLNRVIRDIATSEGLRVYDAYGALADQTGGAISGATLDGIHLSGAAYEKLRPLYETAARDLLS